MAGLITDAAIFTVLLVLLRWGAIILGYPLPFSVLIGAFIIAMLLRIARWFWHGRDRDYVNELLRKRYGGR